MLHADAQRDVELAAGQRERGREHARVPPRRLLRRGRGVHAARHHHELVAAETAHRLPRRAHAFHPPRHRHQQLVPQRVPVGVVHGLEVVEVAEQHRRAALAAGDGQQLPVQPLQQVAPVGQAGEAVLARLALEHPAVGVLALAQRALGGDLRREVLELGHDVEEPPRVVADGGDVDEDRHRVPSRRTLVLRIS